VLDASIDPSVAADFPGYRAGFVLASGLVNGPSDAVSERALVAAERCWSELPRAADHPHIAAWREAFSAFGAKPSRYPSSAEALMSRVIRRRGLPRVNLLVDLYNAVSVRFAIPVGGEDLDAVRQPVRLLRASGNEIFDGAEHASPGEIVPPGAIGQPSPGEVVSPGAIEHPSPGELDPPSAIEHPLPGEVVWADAVGVTCRRWNWRQGRRTRLTETTTRAYFLFDALPPLADRELQVAMDELSELLLDASPGAQLTSTILRAS
jgi:DNA/RNA-binding domain of Phe-tRNA-synthetase-like protein